MKTILIISNFFYPTTHIAAFRIDAFAKYFRKAGYNVYVVTEGEYNSIESWNECNIYYIKDRSLTSLSFKSSDSKCTHFIKAAINIIFINLLLDRKYKWTKKATKVVLDIIEKNKVDIILSSYGFLSSHLVSLKVKEKYPNIKWIADMRDEMSYSPYLPKTIAKRILPLEKRILNTSDLVTTVSHHILNQYRSNSNHNRFIEIYNGYDTDLVKSIDYQDKFTLSFIGNFYGNIKPDNFFTALSNLKSTSKLPPNFIFKIVGNKKNITIPNSIKNNIVQISQIPHDQAIIEAIKSDVLLIILPNDGRKGVYTGKLFDYLSVNRIILALVDVNDVIAKLIQDTNSGFYVNPDIINDIEDSIMQCYYLWKNKKHIERNWKVIETYSRQYQVNRLIKHISNCGW